MQEIKLNQFHKTPNILHFTPITTDCTHKQGEALLTYIKKTTSVFNNLLHHNTFPIELRFIKIHVSISQQLHIANMYI